MTAIEKHTLSHRAVLPLKVAGLLILHHMGRVELFSKRDSIDQPIRKILFQLDYHDRGLAAIALKVTLFALVPLNASKQVSNRFYHDETYQSESDILGKLSTRTLHCEVIRSSIQVS